MAVTSQMMVHTPLAGSGLSIPAANKQREFAKWVDSKEIRNTEFTAWMKPKNGSYELNDIEVGQSYDSFVSTTLGAEAGASDEQVTVASTALLRAGDQIEFHEYYSGSTTEFDDSRTEPATIISIDSGTTMTVHRHEGEVADASYFVHPATTTVVKVVGSAMNYNDPFRDGITFRGDSITQHRQIFENGEITYALSAAKAPDFEAPNGHKMRDVMKAKKDLPWKRNWAFINGRKVTGDYTATPKVPYRLGGAIWFAEQIAANEVPIDGLIDIFTFTDIYEDLETNHSDGPGDTWWSHPRLRTIFSELLMPYKGYGGLPDTMLNMSNVTVKSAFGDTSANGFKTDNQWPMSKMLLTSRADWEWGPAIDFDWTYVERGPEELGAFSTSWNMGGEFSMVCLNISHQRLLTGIDTRKENYAARTPFL
jgi:hypothetical protein